MQTVIIIFLHIVLPLIHSNSHITIPTAEAIILFVFMYVGQFFRRGIDIDPARKLLILPDMEPVPVMRKPIWHFMEREMKQDTLCWVAMNPGYQGKRLIEGKYADYIVQDLLSANFKM